MNENLFRQKMSTIAQLLNLSKTKYRNKDIFIDFKKVFDSGK